MSTPTPSKNRRRRRQDDMRFVHNGPFHPILGMGSRAVRLAGEITLPYTPDSPETYRIADALRGTHAGDVLLPYLGLTEDEPVEEPKPKRRRRRGRRGGRKQVAR